MSLDHIDINQVVKVQAIRGGWGIRQRLGQLGIHVGDLLIIKRSGALGGPLLLQIHNMEIAVGRGMAKKIIVEPIKSESRKE